MATPKSRTSRAEDVEGQAPQALRRFAGEHSRMQRLRPSSITRQKSQPFLPVLPFFDMSPACLRRQSDGHSVEQVGSGLSVDGIVAVAVSEVCLPICLPEVRVSGTGVMAARAVGAGRLSISVMGERTVARDHRVRQGCPKSFIGHRYRIERSRRPVPVGTRRGLRPLLLK